jgi:hypothetical protein
MKPLRAILSAYLVSSLGQRAAAATPGKWHGRISSFLPSHGRKSRMPYLRSLIGLAAFSYSCIREVPEWIDADTVFALFAI